LQRQVAQIADDRSEFNRQLFEESRGIGSIEQDSFGKKASLEGTAEIVIGLKEEKETSNDHG
jgi:hypothetical protein